MKTRAHTRFGVRAGMLLLAVASAVTVTLGDSGTPAHAHPPGPSFSIDLDAGQAGIQSTRSMPIGTPFSIRATLDTRGIAEYIEADVGFHWNDAMLTAPLDGVPLD